MSHLKNTLNFASYAYNASTNTPALANMKDGTVFEVAMAGKVVGTVIDGCALGANSYLLVGDKVVYKNGGYELLSPKIKNGTTISVGTGGLFTTFKDANDYVSKRVYTGVILNQLSSTIETASIYVQNPCGGRLVIYGNGFFIDNSGIANTNCTLSGNNIYIDDFKVKSNIGANKSVLVVSGNIDHQNNISVQNISATGRGIFNCGNLKSKHDTYGTITSNINISVQSILLTAYSGSEPSASLEAFNITVNGAIELAGSNYIAGAITTGGGSFHGGGSSSNYIGGAITTGGGMFYGGASSSNYIGGAIDTGGGSFNGGGSSSNYIIGAITTGGGSFYGGVSSSNYIGGAIDTGGGSFNGGGSSSNYIIGAITTGGGSFHGGVSSSSYITGVIDTGGDMFNGGVSSSNYIGGAITTGGGMFYGGTSSSNYITGAITTGGGSFNGGDNCQTTVVNTITGVGAIFQFIGGTKLYVTGTISGYTIAGTQHGIGAYNIATSAGVLRNQNTATLMTN